MGVVCESSVGKSGPGTDATNYWLSPPPPNKQIRAKMAKTTKEMIQQCMDNAQRERERKEKVERGEAEELEHVHLKI